MLEKKNQKLGIENSEVARLVSDKDMENLKELRSLRIEVAVLKEKLFNYGETEVLMQKSINT